MRLILLGVLLGASAWGTVIIGNMGGPNSGAASISDGTASAEGFTMNAGTNYNLTSVSFGLLNLDLSVPAAGLNIGLFADNGAKPGGSALVTFTLSGNISTGDGNYTATPNSSFQLDASTTYWLILNDPTGNLLSWRISSPAATGPGATDAGMTQGTMTSATQVGSFNPSTNSSPLKYEIDGTPVTVGSVPEPGTLGLVTSALCGLALRRHWRRR